MTSNFMHETRGKDVTTLPWWWLKQWSKKVVGEGDGWNEIEEMMI